MRYAVVQLLKVSVYLSHTAGQAAVVYIELAHHFPLSFSYRAFPNFPQGLSIDNTDAELGV